MTLLPFEYAVRNLGRSRVRLALSVLGCALVVLLVLAAGSFVRGMGLAIGATGGEYNAIILGTGSEESVERSEVGAAVAGLAAASIPGVRTRAGAVYVSPEVHVQMPLRTQSGEEQGPLVLVRGVTPSALLVHSSVRIVEGRFPSAGAEELLVGAAAATRIGADQADLAVGRSLDIDGRPWRIVGRFASPGTVVEAEVWTDLYDLKTTTKRETDSCVVVTLDPRFAEFADVDVFAKSRVDLELTAIGETEYYARLAGFFAPIRAVAWTTAALIGLGGLFGGLNTMYAAFASRIRELGTLQSLGFQRGAIVVSLVQESVLATAAGALTACAIAVMVLDGVAVRFSMGVFGLTVDAPVLAVGLGAGLALGIVGALPPAWRCLRMPIPLALKAV